MKKVVDLAKSLDRDSSVALLYSGVLLLVFEYFYIPVIVQRRLDPAQPISLEAGVTWAVACVVGFTLVPLVLIRTVHGLRPRDIGYATTGLGRHVLVYLGLFALMVPVLLFVSRRPEFLTTYPFVAPARTDLGIFWRWEIAYLAQFVALESFFRGYLLFVLEKRFQATAVVVMAVPYAMIHLHKPFPEAIGALGAGVLLGLLALRYRSFWGGALLHALVALTMDLLATRGLWTR